MRVANKVVFSFATIRLNPLLNHMKGLKLIFPVYNEPLIPDLHCLSPDNP